jgi:hypothetical protein
MDNELQLHIRYQGQSFDLIASELDVGDASTDNQIKLAVASHLGVDESKLRSFAIDRAEGSITLRPEAVFGDGNGQSLGCWSVILIALTCGLGIVAISVLLV